MGLYETRYFLWFFKRDLETTISMIKGQGLAIVDNEQFNLWVRQETKVNFFGLHLFLIVVTILIIKYVLPK